MVAVIALWLIIIPMPTVQADALTVQVDHALSLVGEALTVTIEGQVPGQVTEAVLRVYGPAEPSQVGQADPKLPQAYPVSQKLGSAAVEGQISVVMVLAADTLAAPGAYLVVAEVRSGNAVQAVGKAWLGRVAARDRPLDVAFVWPVALGIHRDPTGVFFDRTLEQAVAGASDSSSGLAMLAVLADRFPDWSFTLAIEPLLLAQLRDMADGYVRLDTSGAREEVSADDPAAQNAMRAVTSLQGLASNESLEIAASPYAGPALGALAAEGWRDGFEQIQLGKQEIQQTLAIGSALSGIYAADLDMTTESLGCYAQASVDHVVVDAQVAADLTEPLTDGAVAARVQGTDGSRVTLLFANSRLRSLIVPPWDPNVLFAGLAAELAAAPTDALVITSGVDFSMPPASYLNAIGLTLGRLSWVETETLTSLLQSHSPATRPVLLNRYARGTQSYIEGAMLASLREAHSAVVDLAAAADPTRAALETARRLLYTAESRWWWQQQTSPQVASIGLAYAQEARALAQGELDKVVLTGTESATIAGRQERMTLSVDNGADYPLEVVVRLAGEGVDFPGGEESLVDLQPGRNEVSVDILAVEEPYRFEVTVLAGNSVLDQRVHTVRPITVMTFLPWAVLAVVVIGGASLLIVLLRRRKQARA